MWGLRSRICFFLPSEMPDGGTDQHGGRPGNPLTYDFPRAVVGLYDTVVASCCKREIAHRTYEVKKIVLYCCCYMQHEVRGASYGAIALSAKRSELATPAN